MPGACKEETEEEPSPPSGTQSQVRREGVSKESQALASDSILIVTVITLRPQDGFAVLLPSRQGL